MRAIVYTRVSSDDQAREGVSLDAQRERCLAYAKYKELEVLEVVSDEAVSARRIPFARRPGGQRVLKALKSGEADCLLALKLDRIFRNVVDGLQTIEQWNKRGTTVLLADEGGNSLDTSTAIGWAMLAQKLLWGELEPRQTAERTKTALAHKKRNGDAYSRTPYGKNVRIVDGRKELVDNPEEQAIISEIKEMRSEGESFSAIARALNERGLKGKNGGKWAHRSVSYLLRNSLNGATG